MTHYEAGLKQKSWERTAAYAEMLDALHATGYRSYAEAKADALSPDDQRRLRSLRFQCRWTALMGARAGIDRDPAKVTADGGKLYRSSVAYGSRSTTSRVSLKRRPGDPEPLLPAVLAECRAIPAAQLASGTKKGGRKPGQPGKMSRGHGKPISVGRGA